MPCVQSVTTVPQNSFSQSVQVPPSLHAAVQNLALGGSHSSLGSSVPLPQSPPSGIPPEPPPSYPEPARRRPVFDPERAEFVEVAIHDRAALSPGAVIAGPAVIVEDETSTVVGRAFAARIDARGYIELVRRNP